MDNSIQKTINYFQFKHIESNRPVDQRHVNELIVKIREKNLLHLFPILVNSGMEVIDGQHRLAAAEQLELYIYYQVDDKISKTDIANVNALSKNWSTYDYINYWTIEKAPGFDKLFAFMTDNPLLSPTTVLMMLSSSQMRNLKALKDGILDVSNYDHAVKIAGVIKEYHGIINFAYDSKFVMAVIGCFALEGYDHEIMKNKLEYLSRRLVKCMTIKEYYELFEEIYNYGSSKNRLSFRK